MWRLLPYPDGDGGTVIIYRFLYSSHSINKPGEVVFAHGSVEFCEAAPIGLADESKKSLYGRETDRDLRSA